VRLVADPRGDGTHRQDLRAAELVALACTVVVGQAGHERLHHVPDPDRRKAHPGPCQGKHAWNTAQRPGETAHQRVAPAEHQGGLDDRPAQVRRSFLANDPLAPALGPQVSTRPVIGVRIERAKVQQPVDPLLSAGRHELADQFFVDAPESRATHVGAADDVDDRVVRGDRAGEQRRVVDVARHEPHGRDHAEVPRPLRVPGRYGHAAALPGECRAEPGTDETGPAEDTDLAFAHAPIIGSALEHGPGEG